MKLVLNETESPALAGALGEWPERVSSAVARTEVLRAVRLGAPDELARARQLIASLSLVAASNGLLDSAGHLDPPGLRSLDAVHVATAASLGEDLGALITYDRRMLAAGETAGLPMLSPS